MYYKVRYAGKGVDDTISKRELNGGAYLAGSFTVEASLIVPVVVLGIVALVWCVFYLRNSVKILSDADYIAFYSETEVAKEGEDVRADKDLAINTQNYFGAESVSANLKLKGREIDVIIDVEYSLPERGLLGSMVKKFREYKLEKHYRMPDPSETARLIKAASKLVDDIKKLAGKKDG